VLQGLASKKEDKKLEAEWKTREERANAARKKLEAQDEERRKAAKA